ncbi:unnamed protein product [Orchesella dallaii]|uniref:Retroviral polymerase SH3-like domain-containing protein n=1 Tax=Orchesella dallaii TaxID=48710 RepID=A0ABP1RI14_9HEXA
MFGCVAYYHIHKEQRKAWEPKAKQGYLVGYDSSTNYRIYCLETRTRQMPFLLLLHCHHHQQYEFSLLHLTAHMRLKFHQGNKRQLPCEMETRYSSIVENIRTLETQHGNTSTLVDELRTKFNSTILKLEKHQTDYNELKFKSVAQAYAISSLVSRLQVGKAVLSETKRKWEQGRLNLPFIDYLNLTLPCGHLCAFEFAKTENCEFDTVRKELYMTFDVPIINENFLMLHADPFTLLKRTDNQTCTLKYHGPVNAIVSNATDCIHPLLNSYENTQEVIVYPVEDCTQDDNNKKLSSSFSVTECDATHPRDHLSFVQLKREANLVYIYCPFSDITIASRVQPCPAGVFTVPFNAEFKINNIHYNGSTVKLKYHEIWEPMWTSKTNWYLFQDDDWNSSLMSSPAKSSLKTSLEIMEPLGSTHGSYSLHTFMTVLTIGLLLLLAYGIHLLHTRNQSNKVIVEAIPLNSVHPDQQQ